MNSSIEALEGNKVKLSVSIDETEFDRDIDSAFRKIAKEVRLPGFRAGKAPRRVLEARIGVAPAREQALRDAIPTYLRKAVREHDVDLIATPEIEITEGAESGPVGFDATCEVRPEINVIGYGGLRVEVPNPAATEDEVDAALDEELQRHGDLVDAERPAEVGDYLTLDLAATRDGEPLGGLNNDDWSYKLGDGWVTDDFDQRLTGASAGDTLTFSAPPKGQTEPADFAVTVSKVQRLVAPELTDDWVAENLVEYETVEEWRAAIRARIDDAKLDQARGLLVGKVTEALVALEEIEAPEPLVASQMQRRAENALRQLASQGIDPEQFLAASGRDVEEFLEGFRPQAEHAVRADLALRAVATAEALDVTDDDIDAEFRHLAMHVRQKPSQIRKAYEANDAIADLKGQLRTTKALDWLLERVEIVDQFGAPLDREPLLAGRHHDHDVDDAADVDDDVDAADDDVEAVEDVDAADESATEGASAS